MTYWKVPGNKLLKILDELLLAQILGFSHYWINFDPELESQLVSRGYKCRTHKSRSGNYVTLVEFI